MFFQPSKKLALSFIMTLNKYLSPCLKTGKFQQRHAAACLKLYNKGFSIKQPAIVLLSPIRSLERAVWCKTYWDRSNNSSYLPSVFVDKFATELILADWS